MEISSWVVNNLTIPGEHRLGQRLWSRTAFPTARARSSSPTSHWAWHVVLLWSALKARDLVPSAQRGCPAARERSHHLLSPCLLSPQPALVSHTPSFQPPHLQPMAWEPWARQWKSNHWSSAQTARSDSSLISYQDGLHLLWMLGHLIQTLNSYFLSNKPWGVIFMRQYIKHPHETSLYCVLCFFCKVWNSSS